jgi:hypothetical protein
MRKFTPDWLSRNSKRGLTVLISQSLLTDENVIETVELQVVLDPQRIGIQRLKSHNTPRRPYQFCREDSEKTNVRTDIVKRHSRAENVVQHFL